MGWGKDVKGRDTVTQQRAIASLSWGQPLLMAALMSLGTGAILPVHGAVEPQAALAQASIPAQTSALANVSTPATVATTAMATLEMPVVGVVQTADNQDQWGAVVTRLNRAGAPFHVMDWASVRRGTDLDAVSTLLLPNVTDVSRRQARVLQSFVERGGHLVVTGPFATAASSDVRQQLRSLVGADWVTALPQPSRLRATPQSRRMVDAIDLDSLIHGGVLLPTGLQSQTLAVWADSGSASAADRAARNSDFRTSVRGAAAIIVTEHTTYLGWNWGYAAADTTVDSEWLKVAIAHQQSRSPASTRESSSTRNPASTETARWSTPTPTRDNPPQPVAVPSQRSPVAPRPVAPRPTPQPLSPSRPSGSPARPTGRPTGRPTDPAEQVAPPGIDVGTGALPIAPLEAIAMGQELDQLMGRFESAMVAANAFTYSSTLGDASIETAASAQSQSQSRQRQNSTNESVLVASTTSPLAPARASGQAETAILQQAKTLADQFDSALARKDYAAARQHWWAARQLLWENFPGDRPIQPADIRAMWFDRGSIVAAGSRQGLAEMFDQLAASGINTIFFETINAGYPIYPSRIAPVSNPLIPYSWDPLADAVDLAHERGMELHAWVWAFAAGNQRHNTLVNQPRHYPGPILASHPTWANADPRGRAIPLGQTKPFLDPANPQVRRYLQGMLTEIVTTYAVDGVQLDYIRYPFQDPSANRHYGYGQAARRRFQRQTGVDPLSISPRDRELWRAWTEFRIQQIDSFVAEVSQQLRAQRPELILSAAVFPMARHERLQKLQQNWEAWAQQGLIDVIYPMSYAMDTNRLQQLTDPWLTNSPDSNSSLGSALMVPGIRLLNLPNSATLDQIQLLRDSSAGGYALFAVENLNNNTDLQQIFQRTQGHGAPASSPIPHRQPFETAIARFDALNREWNYLLATDQLWVQAEALAEWQDRSQTLQAQLRQLAANPSDGQVNRTQQQLQQFHTDFEQWVALYSWENPYRVQTWTNHLEVIRQLLVYGEERRSRL